MERLRVCFGFAVAILLLGWAYPAAAQIERPIHFGIGGGMSVPVGDADDSFDNGFHVEGLVGLKVPGMPFGLRGTVTYQSFDLAQETSTTEGSGSILSGLGNVTFGLPMGPIRPYVTAGLGAYSVKTEVNTETGEVSDTETTFGIDAGAGVEFKLLRLHGFVEARLDNAFTDQGFNPALSDGSTQVLPVTFGLLF